MSFKLSLTPDKLKNTLIIGSSTLEIIYWRLVFENEEI